MSEAGAGVLTGQRLKEAKHTIRVNHYSHSIPAGKSWYVRFMTTIIVWSIPANKNLARFCTGSNFLKVWELSRLWAPDGHASNELTRAIAAALKALRERESVDVVVSFADPNVGHLGGVYRAASWTYTGTSSETRTYEKDGERFPRRSFHSGNQGMTKAQIEARGYREIKLPGKHRFVRGVSVRGRRAVRGKWERVLREVARNAPGDDE